MNKAESNRFNAQNSSGPDDTTTTRFNAVKHGLLAKGITDLDDSDAYEALTLRLRKTYRPIGDLEEFFVERIAFHMIRLQRAGRLEAEYITAEIHPPAKKTAFAIAMDVTETAPQSAAIVSALSAVSLASGFQRYETAIENKLYRAINQLERLQRTRKGEFVPAPESVDISIQHEERESKS